MGTVGLSFGSPTSGAGFDVARPCAEIIGNLQNVETPWKTQLTSLESQDTAISSLGTLFSNLSNDLSSLTDFQGILSQKTGSSSDTNVLRTDGRIVLCRSRRAYCGQSTASPRLPVVICPGSQRL